MTKECPPIVAFKLPIGLWEILKEKAQNQQRTATKLVANEIAHKFFQYCNRDWREDLIVSKEGFTIIEQPEFLQKNLGTLKYFHLRLPAVLMRFIKKQAIVRHLTMTNYMKQIVVETIVKERY